MPLYESVLITRPDVSAQQVESISENLTKIIDDNGGSVTKHEYWGLRNLAYRIKKNRKGHYVLFNIDAPPEAVQEYERNMRISEDVMRYLTIRVDEHEEGPSVQMQSRHGRDDRHRGRRDDRGPRPGGRDGGRPREDRPREDRPREDRPKDDDSRAKTETSDAGEAK
jgi:small subunit ribosomal protein S6